MQQAGISLRMIIDQISRDKGIEPGILVETVEAAILHAAKRTFGNERELEARYNEVIGLLMDKGLAYRCDCSKERLESLREQQMAAKQKPRYDGCCRDKEVSPEEPHVIRFRNPVEGQVVIDDLIRGKVVVQNNELDDLIIRRYDG